MDEQHLPGIVLAACRRLANALLRVGAQDIHPRHDATVGLAAWAGRTGGVQPAAICAGFACGFPAYDYRPYDWPYDHESCALIAPAVEAQAMLVG